MKVTLMRCDPALWAHFRSYHYDPDVFQKSAYCYLAEVDGQRIGFCASIPQRGRFGDDPRPAWRAHKTAILLPTSHPQYFKLWAVVADEQARFQAALGHRFWSTAPIDHAAYRDLPESGWTPSKSDGRKQGYRSHFWNAH